jgi:hypothetical protein
MTLRFGVADSTMSKTSSCPTQQILLALLVGKIMETLPIN